REVRQRPRQRMYESLQALAPLLRRGHERVEPHRILQPERSHPRSLQLAQVRAAPDLLPQIVRQRAQVGSFRAAHEDARIRRTEPEEPRFVDVDLPRLALHLLAGARQLVEPPAVDLARRVHGRRLLHQADEVAQRLANALFAQAFERSRLHRAPGAVLRVGGDAEADDGVVLLVSLADEAGDLGGVADADREHPRGRRIERPGMAATLGLEEALHAADHVEAGGTARFVDHDYAGELMRHSSVLPRPLARSSPALTP